MMMNAIAAHCVASVGFGRAIITVKISIEIPSTTADQSIIPRLPNVSIVPGVTEGDLNKCSLLKSLVRLTVCANRKAGVHDSSQ